MKKLTIIVVALLFYFKASAQTDSTQMRIKALEYTILQMSKNLNYCHSQFRIGVGFQGAAIACFGLSVVSKGDTRTVLSIAGATISLIGSAIMIDSHKYIGDAGWVKITPTGVKLEF